MTQESVPTLAVKPPRAAVDRCGSRDGEREEFKVKSETAHCETQRPWPLSRMWLVVVAVAVMCLATAGAGHADDPFNSVASLTIPNSRLSFPSLDLGNTADLSFTVTAHLSADPND